MRPTKSRCVRPERLRPAPALVDAAQDLFADAGVDTIFLAWSRGQAAPTDSIADGWRVRANNVALDVHWQNENHEPWVFQVRSSYEEFYFRQDSSMVLPGGAHPWLFVRWDDGQPGGVKGEARTTWGAIIHYFHEP